MRQLGGTHARECTVASSTAVLLGLSRTSCLLEIGL